MIQCDIYWLEIFLSPTHSPSIDWSRIAQFKEIVDCIVIVNDILEKNEQNNFIVLPHPQKNTFHRNDHFIAICRNKWTRKLTKFVFIFPHTHTRTHDKLSVVLFYQKLFENYFQIGLFVHLLDHFDWTHTPFVICCGSCYLFRKVFGRRTEKGKKMIRTQSN